MQQFNVHHAKTNFSKLLERVEAGEQIVIARDGEPVATLSPVVKTRFRIGMGTGEFVNADKIGNLNSYAPMTNDEADDWSRAEAVRRAQEVFTSTDPLGSWSTELIEERRREV